jgi:hypothetical protein
VLHGAVADGTIDAGVLDGLDVGTLRVRLVDWLKAQGGTCLDDYGGTLRTRHDQLHNDCCSDNFLNKISSDKPDASGNVEWGYESTAMAFWRSEPLRASRRAKPRSPISNPRPHPSLPPPPQQVLLVRVDDPTDALALSESACAKRADTAAELNASAQAANVIATEPTAELAALLAPPPPRQV